MTGIQTHEADFVSVSALKEAIIDPMAATAAEAIATARAAAKVATTAANWQRTSTLQFTGHRTMVASITRGRSRVRD